MQKPAPPCAVSVGDMGFHKSFSTSGNRTLCDKKVLVSVNEVHYDQASGNWLVLLENQGEMLPRGATWWDVEKSVELPHKKGDEVLVKVNGGFVEGIIEGVERDNGEFALSFPFCRVAHGPFRASIAFANELFYRGRWVDL